VKTHGAGWQQRQPIPGVQYWRTRHGHWARVDHHGTTTLGRHLPIVDKTLLDEHGSPLERHLAATILTH
jgi:hypothetical protein